MRESKIPDLVKKVQLALHHKQPVPPDVIDRVLTLYPDYFPVEAARRKAWDKIPQSVKDSYTKEWNENHDKLFRELDIEVKNLRFDKNPEAKEKQLSSRHQQLRLKEIVFEKKLHRKHFEKYNLKYDG